MNDLSPRLARTTLEERLDVMPAVVMSGARQTGKSTLAKALDVGRRYYSLDDLDVMETARRDPETLLGGGRVTLDEVQRAPEILHTVKMDIDRHREAGRFLLTGSANLLLMNRVSESLAGRASYVTLWPMTRREQLGLGRAGIWSDLLQHDESEWIEIASESQAPPEDWRGLARRGGFPEPAVHLSDDAERAIWFDGYVRTYLERDLLNLSAVASLPDFRRLMRAACLRLGQLVNQTEMGRDVALPQATAHRYLNLLETSYLLVRVPAYSVNRSKRLVKSPRLHWSDTGLALHIAGNPSPTGAHLENVVLADLLAWRDTRIPAPEILYWRTVAGDQVDFVIDDAGQLLPIEVKASRNPRLRDTAGIRSFRKEYSNVARAGLVLHEGDVIEWLAPDVLALPWWRVI
ncbi:MAG: ATP-binding protein [Gammaproteobacteria bacterium]|nr:ATP-binding protein [Gammaproteobacteria bacterium]